MYRIKLFLLSFFGYWVIRLLFSLNREIVLHQEYLKSALSSGRPVLLCCWHGRLLFPVFRWWEHGTHALAGLHQDGEIISRIANKLGWRMLRGSSSRGGARVYIELLKTLEEGGIVFITPDGPHGPEYELKEGAVKSAIYSNALLLPVSGQASWRWEVRNWDTFVIPKPFGRIVHVLGNPIDVNNFDTISDVAMAISEAMKSSQAESDAWAKR